MDSSLIQMTQLTKRLKSGSRMLTILDSVDVSIATGEFVAILGPSGSGKSTMLGLMAGLDRPTEGEVLFDGKPIHTLSEDGLAKWRRDNVGFVFQSFQLLPHFTALENVLFPLELHRKRDRRRIAADLLERVGLDERGHHYPSQLSGGEQQRVAVARAFAAEPRLLLADEPTGNLDTTTGRAVLDAMISLQQQKNTTLVMVTHDPALAKLADRAIFLRDGRVEREERHAEPARTAAP